MAFGAKWSKRSAARVWEVVNNGIGDSLEVGKRVSLASAFSGSYLSVIRRIIERTHPKRNKRILRLGFFET